MTAQFELGSKHCEYKKNAQLIIGEIKDRNINETLKALYNKSYGLIPSNNAAYNDYLGLVLSIEEIAKIQPETASLLVDQIIAQEVLSGYGNISSFSTDNIYAILCAEPGISSVNTIISKAVKTSDGWNVQGKKLVSKEQLKADKFLVYAKDEDNKLRIFEVSEKDLTLNQITRNFAGTDIALNQVNLDIELSDNANVAVINDNYEKIQSISRTLIAAVSVGIAHSTLLAGVNVAKETKDCEGHAISNTQSIQFALADAFAELESSRALTYMSADMIDKNAANIKYATMAKVKATDTASQLSLQSLQLLGNLGYLANNEFADIMQVAINCQVKGGTNRVQKNQIYQYMLARK